MDSDWDNLFTTEEILGGLPARRASTLLFAIEGRTAQLVARSRRAMVRDFTGKSAEQEEQAFLSAVSESASLPFEPAIQDLERYAPNWASLVPAEPSVRAALARLMSEKYRIPVGATPQLQAALGINEPATAERFQELHGVPVSTLFKTELHLRERLRWVKSGLARRLETLPPFWTAFALTLTETVGAGVLALPIAFAELGVAGAIVVMLVLGAVNVITIAAMAEAVARNGGIRYGQAYFGRLVNDYLGRPGLLILTPALLVMYCIILLAYVIGIASTLSDSFGTSPIIWPLVVLAVLLVFLKRDSLDATVASALLIGICSISLLLVLSLLAAPFLDLANLRYSEFPFVNGNDFDAGMLELIFGVALLAFFGHTSTANCAEVVLERDPTARSLIRGVSAAMGTAVALYIFWIFMVNGSVSPDQLASERGTALTPLAEVAGPGVAIPGTLFVILAMGMAAVHMGWGLVNSVREWLPAPNQSDGRFSAPFKSNTGRKLITFAPLIAIIALVELLFAFDHESFSGPIGFLGVIAVPLIAGIFSMLMLAAARRKGDCLVCYSWHVIGNRVVVAGVCVFFLGAIVIHGLFIWTNPLQRVIAIAVSIITAIFMIVSSRTLRVSREVAEIRYNQDDLNPEPTIAVTAGGKQLAGVSHRLHSPESAESPGVIELHIPSAKVGELKVWVHQVTADGCSIPVPAAIQLNGSEPFPVDPSTGRIVIPVSGEAQHLIVQPLGDDHRPGVI